MRINQCLLNVLPTNIGEQIMSYEMNCEFCKNYVYDEEYEGYVCMACMDQDDVYRIHTSKECPYYQSNDDYLIVGKQK